MNKNLSSVLFVSGATTISGIMSYLYHPLMIRYLDIEDFGVLASLLSILNIFLMIIMALGLFYTKEVSRYVENLEYSKTYRELSIKLVTYLSLGLCVLLLLVSPFIGNFLDISFYYILPLGITIIYSFYAVINNAFFQGLGNFKFIAFIISSSSILKLFIGFIGVILGFHIFGALGGVILSQVGMYYIGNTYLRSYFFKIQGAPKNTVYILRSFITKKKQILQYLFTSILIALLINIDILIVKNMFDGETAGYYAAVSVLAKFLIFLGLSIETVYYPQLVKETHLLKVKLLKISIYYAAMTIGAIMFFMLFGEIILRLFKDGLQEYLDLIYPLLLFCGLLGYLSIIVKTLIAFEYYTINYILGVLIVGLIICLYSLGSNPLIITQIFALFGVFGVTLGIIQLVNIKNT